MSSSGAKYLKMSAPLAALSDRKKDKKSSALSPESQPIPLKVQ